MKAIELLRIGELFKSLGWPIEEDLFGQFSQLFERYCRMCARLDDKQRALVVELTRRYMWLPPEGRGTSLLRAWQSMMPQLPISIEAVLVAPLMKMGAERPKSPDAAYYDLLAREQSLRRITQPLWLVPCRTYGIVARHANPSAAIVLVDDYVGSGKTADEAIEHLYTKCPQAKQSLIWVLTVASQAAARAALTKPNCRIVSHHVLPRGISDNRDLDVTAALDVMDDIGSMLGVDKEERLGFGRAEALVTLGRTPNNTFPVFWTDRPVNGVVWDSPFTRYTHDDGSDFRRRKASRRRSE
jgi:hypothetical protein